MKNTTKLFAYFLVMGIDTGGLMINFVGKFLKEGHHGQNIQPWEKSPFSGQVEIVGPRGGKTGEERTITKGERLPPPPAVGQKYIISDRTKNKSGQGK